MLRARSGSTRLKSTHLPQLKTKHPLIMRQTPPDCTLAKTLKFSQHRTKTNSKTPDPRIIWIRAHDLFHYTMHRIPIRQTNSSLHGFHLLFPLWARTVVAKQMHICWPLLRENCFWANFRMCCSNLEIQQRLSATTHFS